MEYGPGASSSEGREGKRVGFSQAHTSRGPLVERAHASIPLSYGQTPTYHCTHKPRGAGIPGKRWRACDHYYSQDTLGGEDGGIAAELKPGSWYDPGGVIHTGGHPFETYPIQRHTVEQLEEMLPVVCEHHRLTRSRAPDRRPKRIVMKTAFAGEDDGVSTFFNSPRMRRLAHPSHGGS